ncbi:MULTISPECIES: FtsB family cell division protein [Aequorivita]|uniref:Septum formation initiator family protein n=1 Tax=Aequorivita iocasae TaxID=2803865 RepID=A0ABX7DSN1_9FLAO|nr:MULTISPECIES: septum formation initiator family protein [Aequorivita]QQX76601.1 septum formation initiator family protein [Aequorivita iocasae]UCA56072.1 septum formation initiator family protein [Aequorivita sp. F7]
MKLSELKKNKWIRFISNKYVLILLLFVVWMIFFDANSYLIHHELDSDINALEENAEFYQNEIDKDKTFIKKMEDSNEMEKFAREKYYLKKENEDIYIIEHEDSIKKEEKR